MASSEVPFSATAKGGDDDDDDQGHIARGAGVLAGSSSVMCRAWCDDV
jgi:hypothetical protein